MYTPDRWTVLKIESKNEEDQSHYRLFGCWIGGYAGSDSWRMNSGITSVEESDDLYLFKGSSGSIYRCHKNAYGLTSYGASVLHNLIEDSKGEISILQMPEDTDFMRISY